MVVGTYDGAVTIIDISDPYSPAMAAQTGSQDGITDMTGTRHLDVVSSGGGTYALVTSETSDTMQVIDITDPASPTVISTLKGGTTGAVSAISMGAGTYVVAVDTFGDVMQVIDITDPASPVSVSATESGPDSLGPVLGSGIASVTVDGQTYALSAAYSQDAVRITDITDPSQPVPVYTIRDGHDGFDMAGPVGIDVGAIKGKQYALVAGFRDSVIQVVDVSDPEMPVPVSSIRNGEGGIDRLGGPVGAELVKISGVWYAVVASTSDSTLHVIYMDDPAAPFSIAAVGHGEGGFDLTGIEDVDIMKIGSRTFAAVSSFADSSVRMIDITNPADPRPASLIRGGEKGYDLLHSIADVDTIKVGERSLLVAAGYRMDAVIVVDISDPYNPVRLSGLRGGEGGGYMHALEDVHAVSIGDGAYVVAASAKDSAQIIDITNPESPSVASITGLGLDGTTVYGVIDVDVAQTDSATVLLAMTDNENVLIIDVSEPYSPALVASIPPAYVATR